MKVLVVESGAAWGTAEVEAGLCAGLVAHGVDVVRYRLDVRLARARRYLLGEWRFDGKPTGKEPTTGDLIYHASTEALIKALREQVDAVIVVAAIFFSPDVIILMRRAGLAVTLVLTESPYDMGRELEYAGYASGCWTSERSVVPQLRAVAPHAGYLPHGWHPTVHRPESQPDDAALPAHDVVVIGTGFADRIKWLEAIDWTGIDLGIYGHWDLPRRSKLRPFLRDGTTANTTAAGLYRRARLGLNLYRQRSSLKDEGPYLTGESLNPRAYEMAACGLPHVSTPRAEVAEIFGDLVPTATTPEDGAAAIRAALAESAAARQLRRMALIETVAEASWITRATTVLADLRGLVSAA
jgi:hypothetical protein